MKRALFVAGWLILGSGARAHDMFLVVPGHDVPAHQDVTVALYNGTFESSENVIDRDRMADVSVVDGRPTGTTAPTAKRSTPARTIAASSASSSPAAAAGTCA